MLLGQYEIFGMEEIIDDIDIRRNTVRCASFEATAFFIKKDHFIDAVNNFKFNDLVLNE